jgi:uncharacterized protein (DUF2267 family)
MAGDFDKYAVRGKEFVKLVAEELKVPRDKALRITRAVLHALRNRLSHEESFQLLAQLPMMLKAIYVDGWKFKREFRRISHVSDFLDEVRLEDGGTAGYDFGNDARARTAVSAVFKAMNYFVSEGEVNSIIAVLPAELKEWLRESMASNESIL